MQFAKNILSNPKMPQHISSKKLVWQCTFNLFILYGLHWIIPFTIVCGDSKNILNWNESLFYAPFCHGLIISSYLPSILQFGWRQDTPCYSNHLCINWYTKVLNVRISIEISPGHLRINNKNNIPLFLAPFLHPIPFPPLSLPSPRTSLLISVSLSGAVLDVAFIILEVCISDNFLIHLWPGTRSQT